MWGLIACVAGGGDPWAGRPTWEGVVDETPWQAIEAGAERAAGRWAPMEPGPDVVAEEEEAFGPYVSAPYEDCDPNLEQCSWERDGIAVDWFEMPNPWEFDLWRTEEEFRVQRPVVRLGDGAARMPVAWNDTIVWTSEARRYEAVPREGCATLQGTGSTGGAHCCTLHLLVTVCPEGATVSLVDAQQGEDDWNGRFLDIDGDASYEFLTTDWSWIRGSFPYSLPPPIWRVLAWSARGWEAADADRFLEFYEDRELEAIRETQRRAAAVEHPSDAYGVAVDGVVQAGSYAFLGGASEEELRETYTDVLGEVEMEIFLREARAFMGPFERANTLYVATPVDP